jgi:hypothetical protein
MLDVLAALASALRSVVGRDLAVREGNASEVMRRIWATTSIR